MHKKNGAGHVNQHVGGRGTLPHAEPELHHTTKESSSGAQPGAMERLVSITKPPFFLAVLANTWRCAR